MSLPEGTNPLDLTPQQQLQYAIDAGYPLHEPPAGIISDFVNGNTIAYQLYITAGVCIPLMAVSGLFRLLNAIKFSRQNFFLDELVFVLAFVLCLTFTAMSIAALDTGIFGHHAWDVRLADWTPHVIMLSLLLEMFAPLGICAVKVSVLILYLRIFGGPVRWMRITCIIGIVMLFAYHVSFAIAFGAMCAPDPTAGYSQIAMLMAFLSDSCMRTKILVFLMGVGNSFIDLVLLFLPLPVIWKLHMPLRKKVKTSATFLIGVSACIASVFGLVVRVQYYYGIDSDPLRIVIPLHATTMAEMTAGIAICCGPSAAIVFRALWDCPVFASSTTQSTRLVESLGSSRPRFKSLRSEQTSSLSKGTEESLLRICSGSTKKTKEGSLAMQSVMGPRDGWPDVDFGP